MTRVSFLSPPDVWARFRFSVVGPLLSAPPARGELQSALRGLAAKTWKHPVTGRYVQFSVPAIERWYYTARRERDDPVAAAGQALRGSGDLHAFGDSNLYLKRSRDRLLLSSEHRAAPAAPPVYLELVSGNEDTTRLEVVAEGEPPRRPDLSQQILELLASGQPYSRVKLRETLAVKNERLGEDLQTLEQTRRIARTSAGWQCLD